MVHAAIADRIQIVAAEYEKAAGVRLNFFTGASQVPKGNSDAAMAYGSYIALKALSNALDL